MFVCDIPVSKYLNIYRQVIHGVTAPYSSKLQPYCSMGPGLFEACSAAFCR